MGSKLLNRLLMNKVLVLLAHPDDESLGAGVYLQVCRNAELLFFTSGDRVNNDSPSRCQSDTAKVREEETLRATGLLKNVQAVTFERIPDGRLHQHLNVAAKRLQLHLERMKPDLLLTHTFEGGHPDHDCCSFLASRVALTFGIPVVEFPEYSSEVDSLVQEFRSPEGVSTIRPTREQALFKSKLLEQHASQAKVFRRFDVQKSEEFRYQPAHPYFSPRWRRYFIDVRVQDVTANFLNFDASTLEQTLIC